MANQWFKFYGGEYLSDPKIGRLSPAERSCWVTLLCLASQSDDGVIKYLTTDSLLTMSGIVRDPYNDGDWERCQSLLEKLNSMEMIVVDSEKGVVTLKNWSKRQDHQLSVAERVAKHRAKKELEASYVTNSVTNVTTEENRIEENRRDNTSEIVISRESEGDPEKAEKPERRVKDKEATYGVFSSRKEGWMNYKQERLAALRLFDRGLDKVCMGKKIMKEHEDDPYCPQADTPSEYEKKHPQLVRFMKRNGIEV